VRILPARFRNLHLRNAYRQPGTSAESSAFVENETEAIRGKSTDLTGSFRPRADMPEPAELNTPPLFEPPSQHEPDRQFDPSVRDERGAYGNMGSGMG
jgi:hypothetical protein